MGHDQPRNLGRGETGGSAALPMWVNYMRTALKSLPEKFPSRPDGLLATYAPDSGREEFIYSENLPPEPMMAPAGNGELPLPAEAPDEALPQTRPAALTAPAPVVERSPTPIRR